MPVASHHSTNARDDRAVDVVRVTEEHTDDGRRDLVGSSLQDLLDVVPRVARVAGLRPAHADLRRAREERGAPLRRRTDRLEQLRRRESKNRPLPHVEPLGAREAADEVVPRPGVQLQHVENRRVDAGRVERGECFEDAGALLVRRAADVVDEVLEEPRLGVARSPNEVVRECSLEELVAIEVHEDEGEPPAVCRIPRRLDGLFERGQRERTQREQLTRGGQHLLAVDQIHDLLEDPSLHLGVPAQLTEPIEGRRVGSAGLELAQERASAPANRRVGVFRIGELREPSAGLLELAALAEAAPDEEPRLLPNRGRSHLVLDDLFIRGDRRAEVALGDLEQLGADEALRRVALSHREFGSVEESAGQEREADRASAEEPSEDRHGEPFLPSE